MAVISWPSDGVEGTSMTNTAASVLGIIVFLIVIEIAGHVVITIFHDPETADERNEFVSGRAARPGYFVPICTAQACAATMIPVKSRS